MSTFTLKDLRDREFDLLDIAEPWRSAVGRIEQRAYGLLHGPAGSGKSTLMLGFAGHELTRHGTVFYNSSEEGESFTLQNKAENLNLTSYDRFVFGEYREIGPMLMAAAKAGADFIVVDSITDMGATKEDLADLKAYCKDEGIGLWVIVQERKDGRFRGPSNLEFDTDIVARVIDEGVLQTSKNRYDQVEDARVPFSEAELRAMGGPEGSLHGGSLHGDGTAGAGLPALSIGGRGNPGAEDRPAQDRPDGGQHNSERHSSPSIWPAKELAAEMGVQPASLNEAARKGWLCDGYPVSEWAVRHAGSGRLKGYRVPKGTFSPRDNPGAACVVDGTWQRNQEQEGVEITFSDRPPPALRERLKARGFIYASQDQYWFADATNENVALAKEMIGEGDAAPAPELPPAGSEGKPLEGKPLEGKPLAGGDPSVMILPVEAIQVDPERFQPREQAYSEETARTIAEDFDEQKMEPIRVWHDPEAGGWHVLAGFSRLEGYKRRGADTIPAREFEGTEEEAIRFAWEENEKGAALTNTERAAYLRMLRESGEFSLGALREKAQDLYGRDARRILALSFLDTDGKALQTLRQLKTNSSGDYNAAETMAVWTGKVRRYNRDLTDSHEREIYNFLLDNYRSQGKGFTTASSFREFVEEVKGRRSFMGEFEADQPLNFAEIVPKSPQQEQIDRLVREARAEFREARKELDAERKTYLERGAEGADFQRAIAPFQEAVDAAQKHVIEVEQEARAGRSRLAESEQGLFDTLRENPASIEGFMTQLGACRELETTEALYRAQGDPMFTGPEGRLLLIVPNGRVRPVREALAEGAAEAADLYGSWHGFAPDADVAIDLPAGLPFEPAGTAERIIYESDKIMRAGDARGKGNLYEHIFDPGERAVFEWGDALIVAGLKIDRRGILN